MYLFNVFRYFENDYQFIETSINYYFIKRIFLLPNSLILVEVNTDIVQSKKKKGETGHSGRYRYRQR